LIAAAQRRNFSRLSLRIDTLRQSLAASQQIAAAGRTETEGCTKAHNEVVRWSQQYGWQLAARGQQMSEGQALGQYHAVLKAVLDSNHAGSPIAPQTWRQYRDINLRVSHLIPRWAVTSLSARGKVPFACGFFDLLAIDEAS
jgi:hypothetical protein